jgi:hypothetical protein
MLSQHGGQNARKIMVDPFESSKRKLVRAKQHIYDFESCFRTFKDEYPCIKISEPDVNCPENIVHKLRLTKPVPESLDLIAADVVNNLRTVLDQAIYGVSIASGHTISHAKFPFSGDVTEFERAVQGKAKYLPQEILALLRTFKSYKGGNDLLCALNDWCNTDKHALVSAVETCGVRTHTRVQATGFMSTPTNPVWDRAKHEIELFTVSPHTEKFEYDFNIYIFVSFDQIEVIRGKEAITVLYAMAAEVERILMAIEAEAMRIGLVN